MAVSKVILNGVTEIDLTGDTATVDKVKSGETFHLANGTQGTGTMANVGATAEKDVNFYDYDGTIVASYEASEIADLAELPIVPTHSGLTSQGWNWTLANLKTQVADTGACDVGATYTTNDNSTRLYVSLRSGRLSPCLGICPNGEVSIDWGDSTSSDSLIGTSLTTPHYATHTYSQAGDYVISISVTSGSFAIYGTGSYSHLLKRTSSSTANDNAVYLNSLTRVELGNNVSIGNYAFYGCNGLKSITIPTTVTRINDGAFWNCYNLSHLTVPSSVTVFGSNLFRVCHRLLTMSLPKELTTIGSNLSYDSQTVKRIVVPRGITATTGNCFYNNFELSEAYLSNTVTTLGAGSFQSCRSLKKIKMPTGLTDIGQYVFSGCSSLLSVEIPSGVKTIDSYAFSSCVSLASITIPSTVTTINANAFNSDYGLSEIHFKPTSPPTVANANAFTNLPTDCVIYVPTGKLSAYTSATNYPSSGTYTYVEE